MLRIALLMLVALLCLVQTALARGAPGPEFSAAELKRILVLGPWPPRLPPDPSNRVSGQALAIELGRRLFRDPRMSPVGYIACVTCHQPDRSFTDQKARAHGLADLPRNTPALANLRLQHWFGWGGSSDSLWMASIRPMLDAREFDSNPRIIARIFERDKELAACYVGVFRVSPLRDLQRTTTNVGKALAAYIETFVTGRTPFDDFRAALLRNNAASLPPYPVAAQRGLKLFIGQAGCVACHNGPNFSDGEFHAGRVPAGADAAGAAGVDTGRLEGARMLKASRFNLLGPYNDDPTLSNAKATRRLVVEENARGQYRTPSLRNVAVTAPYMHNGQVEQLQDAVRHVQQWPRGRTTETPAPLAAHQVDDLTAFLLTLTDQYGERRPWSSTAMTECPKARD